MEFWEPKYHLDDNDIWYGTFSVEDAEGDVLEVVMYMMDEDDYSLTMKCKDFSYYNFGSYEIKKMNDTIEKTRRELVRIEGAWFGFDDL